VTSHFILVPKLCGHRIIHVKMYLLNIYVFIYKNGPNVYAIRADKLQECLTLPSVWFLFLHLRHMLNSVKDWTVS